jgi:hypothetical protein
MSTLISTDPLQSNGKLAAQADSTGSHPEDGIFTNQIERILRSNELNGSEELRRLLSYLGEKTISGEADELKEYTVATEGLGKPSSYDPRHTSAVRIQAGRLRQKLADYYRGEGSDDAVVISLPKGHFRLSCLYRNGGSVSVQPGNNPAAPSVEIVERQASTRNKIRIRIGAISAIALISIALNIYLWARHPWSAGATNISALSDITPAINDLWSPFIASNRPLMLVLEDPLFVEFHAGDGIYYRDKRGMNTWEVVSNSPGVKKLREVLGNPQIESSRYYTAFGEARAAFVVGRLFGNRNHDFFTLTKASEVSSAQMAANNILAVGIPTTIFEAQLKQMPIQTKLQFLREGIRNLNPGAGEQAMYSDQFSTSPLEEGTAYALVSHLPGPQRNTDVESFVGNRSAAYVAAVEAFANPDFARELDTKLRAQGGGSLPRYFQVVLKVTFKDSVPTETTCVLVKELR